MYHFFFWRKQKSVPARRKPFYAGTLFFNETSINRVSDERGELRDDRYLQLASRKRFSKSSFPLAGTHLPLSSQPSTLIDFLKNEFLEIAFRR